MESTPGHHMEPMERGFSELVWKASPLSLP